MPINKGCEVVLVHPRPTPGNSCTVPYSCLAVAAPLVAAGIPVCIVDEFSSADFFGELRQAAKAAAVVGISCFTGYQIQSAVRAAAFLRQQFPDLPIVWGGYHPSLYPETTLQSPLADYVVAGQGEWIFLDFVQRLLNGGRAEETPGLWRKRNGAVAQNPGAPPFRALEDFPRFPFELLDLRAYLIDSLTPRSISYHSSLGCPFRCNFCTVVQVFNQRWSGFSAERVIEDVRYLRAATGAQSVEFYDNNFFVNDARTAAIAEGLLRENLNILWSAEARPDKIAAYDDDMLQLLTRSGLRWVFIGAESGHDAVLQMMERDHTVEEILRAAEKLARHRIKVTFSFNIGYPGEPPDNFARTRRLANRLRRLNPQTELMVYITTAYEATPSFHRAREIGSRATASLTDWSHLDQRSGSGKLWLDRRYSRKLHNYSLATFYATGFLQRRLRQQFPGNPFLRLLHAVASAQVRIGWFGTILPLRILNRLFRWSSRIGKPAAVDMWSGRS